MAGQLTKRQREVLAFIESDIKRRGIPPTVREIASHFGIASPNGVWCHLRALEGKGFIRKEPGVSRGTVLVPTEGRHEDMRYPVVGEVAAGEPKLAVQSGDETLTLYEASGARPGDFLLKVKGDSMAGAGINPGDMAVVRPGAETPNGGIAVVMVGEEEATLKRYYREKGGIIRLAPENPAYQPVVIDPRERPVRVLGRVVGVIRRY